MSLKGFIEKQSYHDSAFKEDEIVLHIYLLGIQLIEALL